MMGIKWSKSVKVLVAGSLLLVQSILIIGTGSPLAEAASADGPFVTRAVSVGVNHSCAVMSDKTVKCWGANDRGQLGDGTTTNRDFPVDVNGVSNALSVAVGHNYSCALLEGGTVMCWGSAMYTGTGDPTSIAQPQTVSDLSGVTQISAGIWQTCALTTSGEVFCWGARSDIEGPVANTFPIASVPYQITELSQVEAISVGQTSACALIANATVRCWGQQFGGNLGNGESNSTRIATPVTVTGISNATGISLSSLSGACATLSTGSVKCWGPRINIQLGISLFAATVPVLVPGISSATVVALNYSVGCAILSSGSVKCWGATSGGLIGAGPFNGTTWLPATTVVDVLSAVEVSIGTSSACVRLTNGYVKCWGSNSGGQIAQGFKKSITFSTPVFIKGPNVITLGLPTNKSLGDDPFSMASIASTSSGLPVTFTSIGLACLAKEDMIIVKEVGSCRITANQVGSDHVAAALPVSTTFVVNEWSGLRTNAVVTFRFRTTEGLPVTGLRVTWRALGAENPATGTANVTAANGSLTMSVISGPTLISVTSLYQSDDNSSFRKNSVDFFLNNYTTTRLLTQGEVVIDVGERPSHINKVVNVELADGTPVRGATVFLAVKTNIWEPPSRTLTGKKLTGFATWHTANQANNSWPCGPNGNSYFDSSETNVRGSTDVDGRLVLKAFTSTGSDNQVTACYNDTEFAQTRTVSFSPSGPTTIVLGYMARVNVSVSSLSVASGGSESVSAQVVDANGSPVSSQSVQVMAGSVDATATALTCAGSQGTTNSNGYVMLKVCPSASGNYFLRSNGALSSRLIYVTVGSASPANSSGGSSSPAPKSGGGGGDDEDDAAPVVAAPKSTPTTTTTTTAPRIIAAPKPASVPVMPAKAGVVVPNVVQPKAAVAQGLAIAASSNSLTVALKAPVSSSAATKITSYVVTMRSSTGAFIKRVVVPVKSSGQTVAPSFKVAKAGNYVIEISGRNSKGKSLGSYKSAPVKVGG
jgi:alpha-tubulin suppressor-like RCC1 family protein